MRIETTPPSSQIENQSPISSKSSALNHFQEDTLSQPLILRTFVEDVCGFFCNLFLWPIHGYQIFMHQMFFLLLLPTLLPVIFMAEVFRIIFDLFTCGCFRKVMASCELNYALKTPDASEKNSLSQIIEDYGNDKLPKEQQVDLLHIFDSFLSHTKDYNTSEFGKKNGHLQALIKVTIDGKTKLFKYHPGESRKHLHRNYLSFLAQHGHTKSVVKHTFVKLDYSYFIGMFRMKIKTDTVKYQMATGQDPEHIPCMPFFFRFLFPKKIGTHESKATRRESYFAFWPGNTRRVVCDLINQSLKGQVDEYQISLVDLNGLVR